MPVASSSLLQLGPVSTATSATGAGSSKTAAPSNDAGSSFSDVYANQQNGASASAADAGVAARSDSAKGADNKTAAAGGNDGKKAKVADAGKDLPPGKSAAAKDDTKTKAASDTDNDDKVAQSDKADEGDEADSADAVASSTLVSLPQPEPLLTAAAPAQPPLAPQPDPQAVAQQAVVATPVQAAPVAANDASPVDDFDPAADALEGLPMVRMALEHNAKAQGTTSAHAQTAESKGNESTSTQPSFADSLSAVVEQQQPSEGSAHPGEGSLASAADDSTPALAPTAQAPRAEDFASRLNSLAAATPGVEKAASTAAQPLQMQQSGWTEGLVNRVMYLSSQNLKSADIQLHPLELGRLDIRVDVTADQQTQVTFTSVHPAVREALDNQQGRLRDMLNQQGLNNVDVNVSDQSRQQQQQQQQQHLAANAQRGNGTGGAGGQGGDGSIGEIGQADAVSQPQVVVGSSVVDYYA